MNVVEEMAIASENWPARVGMWACYDDPNARSRAAVTGDREPRGDGGSPPHPVLCCQWQGVVAHETAHAQVSTSADDAACWITGSIALMSDGMGLDDRGHAKCLVEVGGVGRNRGRGRRESAGAGAAGVLGLDVVAAPIVSRILAMAVSRKRRYFPFVMCPQSTLNLLALASALEKLEAAASPTRAITRGAVRICESFFRRRACSRAGKASLPMRWPLTRLSGRLISWF